MNALLRKCLAIQPKPFIKKQRALQNLLQMAGLLSGVSVKKCRETGRYLCAGKLWLIHSRQLQMKLTILIFSFLTLAVSHAPKASEQTSSFSGPDGISIHFKSGRPNTNDSLMSSIDDFSKSALDKNIEILKRYPQLRVELLGFTDDRECSGKYCRELSTRRVQRVLDWILSSGIPRSSVVKVEGKSTEMPIGDNQTEEGRAINRRVEFNLSL